MQDQPESYHSQNAASVDGPMDARARRSCCLRGEARPSLVQSVVDVESVGASDDVRQKKFLLKYGANVGERYHWRIGGVLPLRGDK